MYKPLHLTKFCALNQKRGKTNLYIYKNVRQLVGSLKKNTALEYSTRVVQEGDRRCKKSTLNDLAYLTPLRIPLMNPANVCDVYTIHYSCVMTDILHRVHNERVTSK
jgi:hypothetical protein